MRRLAAAQSDGAVRQSVKTFLALFRVVEKGDQGAGATQQIKELREGRKDLAVHGDFLSHPLLDVIDRVKMPGRKEMVRLRPVGRKSPGMRVFQAAEIMGFDVEERLRVDLGEGSMIFPAVLPEIVRVVVGGTYGIPAVCPVDDLLALTVFDPVDMGAPMRVPSRQIYQDAVEAIPLLQCKKRLPESFRRMPDFHCGRGEVQEVVPQGELAHDRDAIHGLMSHRGGDPGFSGHSHEGEYR